MRTQRRAVNNNGSLLLVFLVDISKIKSLRLRKIHLIGCQSKFTSNGTPNLNINFGSVKSRFIFYFYIAHAHALQHTTYHIFCLLPQFWHVDVLLTQLLRIVLRESHHILINTKLLEIFQIQGIHPFKFFLKLCFGAINVCVVHLQTAHPHQTKQLTALLVAITSAVFSKTQWQFLISMRQGLKDLVVVRTVHRL